MYLVNSKIVKAPVGTQLLRDQQNPFESLSVTFGTLDTFKSFLMSFLLPVKKNL